MRIIKIKQRLLSYGERRALARLQKAADAKVKRSAKTRRELEKALEPKEDNV